MQYLIQSSWSESSNFENSWKYEIALGYSSDTALKFICECNFDTDMNHFIASDQGAFLGYTGDLHQILYVTKHPSVTEQWVISDDFVGKQGVRIIVIMHRISGRYLTVKDGKFYTSDEINENCFWEFFEADIKPKQKSSRFQSRILTGDL